MFVFDWSAFYLLLLNKAGNHKHSNIYIIHPYGLCLYFSTKTSMYFKNVKLGVPQSKKKSNDQELRQSDPISFPQNHTDLS